MRTPPRLLRTQADELDRIAAILTTRDVDRRDRILKLAEPLFARFGRHTITFNSMALALRIAPATLRRLFLDLDCLLAEILHRHLMAISKAIGEVPRGAPNLHAERCAAYVAATRLPFGGLTPAHFLMTRDRLLLPDDLREVIDSLRESIALLLSPDNGLATIGLLDTPGYNAKQLNAMIAAAAQTASEQAEQAEQAEPAETPKPPTRPVLVASTPQAETPAPDSNSPISAKPRPAFNGKGLIERHPDDYYDHPDPRIALLLNTRGPQPPPC